MRAAVIEDIKKIVIKEDYPKPIPGPDEALVKVHYCEYVEVILQILPLKCTICP